jgi:hypothetical protein
MPECAALSRQVPDRFERCLAVLITQRSQVLAPRYQEVQVRGLIARHGGRALIFVAARRQQDLASPAGQEQVKLAGNGS